MVEIRWAHRGEAPKVYPLFRALVEAEQAEPPRPSEFSRTWGRSFRDDSHFHFVVAEGEAKRLVGCMSLHEHFSTWKGAPVVSLEDFFVLPEERSKGIGASMLLFAHAHAASLGAARIELDVRRDNPRAQALYKRNAFEEQPYLWLHKPVDPKAAARAVAREEAKKEARGERRPFRGPPKRNKRRPTRR